MLNMEVYDLTLAFFFVKGCIFGPGKIRVQGAFGAPWSRMISSGQCPLTPTPSPGIWSGTSSKKSIIKVFFHTPGIPYNR